MCARNYGIGVLCACVTNDVETLCIAPFLYLREKRQVTYIANSNVSKTEQKHAKKGLSHAWIGADYCWKVLRLFQVFKATVWALQNTIVVAVDVQPV